MDSSKFVEDYAILMLGVKKSPVPSILHLQKELFILSKLNPKVQEHFDFIAYYKGPFSPILNSVIEDSVYVKDAFDIKNNKILLGEGGCKEFKRIIEKNKDNPRLQDSLLQMSLIRDLYEKLTEKELLLLIYDTYKEFPEKSLVSDEILNNKEVTNLLINSLLSKSIITLERYNELKERYSNERRINC